jgi:phospholipid/cholesterol/gamma-HCH transport system permease protein
MEIINLQQSENKNHEAQIIPENFSEPISDSVFKKFFLEVSSIAIFTLRFFKEVFKPPYELNELIKQSFLIGYKSLLLVGITGFIIGLVFTIQSRPTLAKFGAESWLPAIVAVSTIREIVPIITALIFAGKVGSGIGAELASMNVTEQIDAMQVSGTNPFKYLVVTRVLSATLMLPLE